MCGIVGKLNYHKSARIEQGEIHALLQTIVHRGPDGSGIHVDHNVGLGHRRLSIIDLNTGSQPMANEDDTIWIVFNGEIYNFKELREFLLARGHKFKSQTDTEVIIHLYEEHGLDCLQKLRGMFAFAIWDKNKQRLFIARDRVGIKPLYYQTDGHAFRFASEVKAILADSSVPRDLDLLALRKFFSFYYLPGEDTLHKGIRKLLPGHYLTVDQNGCSTRQYWDLNFTDTRWSMPYEQAVEELSSLLKDRVQDHMMSDVPVGILLSGGMDSSAICSLAAAHSNQKLHTFTIGFDDPAVVDERKYARLAAEKFGTEHHELTFSKEDFWNALPLYVNHMEEPVCEPPAIALYYLTKLAREHVKVLLSGEGGDEAFAGYPNYPRMLQVQDLRRKLGSFNQPARSAARFIGKILKDPRYQAYGDALVGSLSETYYSRASSPGTLFNSRAKEIFTPEFLDATSSFDPAEVIAPLLANVKKQPLLNQLLYIDTKTWLPDDLLVKADKMTMANSVELRVPLLDHTVLEFAASLPPEYKVQDRETKRILKSTFAKTLPNEIISRKKAGFPVPYERWMQEGSQGTRQNRSIANTSRSVTNKFFLECLEKRVIKQSSKEQFSLSILNHFFGVF